ncbi:hypothetical protein Tco_0810335 [Tanacetum coccineum]
MLQIFSQAFNAISLVVPLKKVGDEAVHKELGDRMERAVTTASSLAEQDSGSGPRCQDTILGDVDVQTRFETTSIQSNDPPLSKVNTFGSGEDTQLRMGFMLSLLPLMEETRISLKPPLEYISNSKIQKTATIPHDPPLLGGHTPGSDEGRLKHDELMELVTKLSDRVVAMEEDLKQTKKTYSTALTKLLLKVKKLEKHVRSGKVRRKGRIILLEDEEAAENPSK